MSPYRVVFHAKGDAETLGLPDEAFQALVDVLVVVSRDPWRRSRRDGAFDDPVFRWAAFDHGLGVVDLIVDEEHQEIRVYGVTWTG